MDVALAEEAVPDVPVEEAVPDAEIDLLMDEPEAESVSDDVFDVAAEIDAPETEVADGVSDLTGLDKLEDDEDMEDVESLLDNVEVDVSDVEDPTAEDIEALDMPDIDTADLIPDVGDMLTAEVMPPDVGVNVSDDVDVDQLLVDVRTEASASVMAELQDKVTMLEGRVEELENRLREEIAQLVPAEAARIIREEIAALASELDD